MGASASLAIAWNRAGADAEEAVQQTGTRNSGEQHHHADDEGDDLNNPGQGGESQHQRDDTDDGTNNAIERTLVTNEQAHGKLSLLQPGERVSAPHGQKSVCMHG